MFDFIEKMHQKPEHKRRRFALGVSAGVVAVIFIVWLSVRVPGMSGDVASAKKNIFSPLSSIRQSAAAAFQGISGSVDDLKGKMNGISEEYEAKVVPNYTATTEETTKNTAGSEVTPTSY